MRKTTPIFFALLSVILLSGCYTNLALVSPDGVIVRAEPVSSVIGVSITPLVLSDCDRYQLYPTLYRSCVKDYFKYRTTFYTYRYPVTRPVYIYNTVIEEKPDRVYRSRNIVSGTKSSRSRGVTRSQREGSREAPNVIRPTRSRDTGRSTQTEERTRSSDRSRERSGNNS